MIWDTWENRGWYNGCHPLMEEAFEFIEKAWKEGLPPGRYPLRQEAYALVQEYDLSNGCRGRWESHRRYIDVQCLLSGTEMIGCGSVADQAENTPYDEEKDIQFYPDGEGISLKLHDGAFGVFFPQDAHCPQCWGGVVQRIRKVVVKLPCQGG